MLRSLVGSEMCIRGSCDTVDPKVPCLQIGSVLSKPQLHPARNGDAHVAGDDTSSPWRQSTFSDRSRGRLSHEPMDQTHQCKSRVWTHQLASFGSIASCRDGHQRPDPVLSGHISFDEIVQYLLHLAGWIEAGQPTASQREARCAFQPFPSIGRQEHDDEKEVRTNQEIKRTLGSDIHRSQENEFLPNEILHGKRNIAVQPVFPPTKFRLHLEPVL